MFKKLERLETAVQGTTTCLALFVCNKKHMFPREEMHSTEALESSSLSPTSHDDLPPPTSDDWSTRFPAPWHDSGLDLGAGMRGHPARLRRHVSLSQVFAYYGWLAASGRGCGAGPQRCVSCHVTSRRRAGTSVFHLKQMHMHVFEAGQILVHGRTGEKL